MKIKEDGVRRHISVDLTQFQFVYFAKNGEEILYNVRKMCLEYSSSLLNIAPEGKYNIMQIFTKLLSLIDPFIMPPQTTLLRSGLHLQQEGTQMNEEASCIHLAELGLLFLNPFFLYFFT